MDAQEQLTITAIAEREGASAVLAALAAWCDKAARDCDRCEDPDSGKDYRRDSKTLRTLSEKFKATNN